MESALISPQSNYPGQEKQGENYEDDVNPEKIGTQYRYHLHMKSLQENCTGKMTDKPFIPVSGLTEGNDWEHNEDTGM